MTIQLYNTLTRSTEEFIPLHDDTVDVYSCGPTVYNVAHIGNMRAFLFADLLQRVLRVVGGYQVRWVMNITDIDDKTIRDSAPGSSAWKPEMGAQGTDPQENLRQFTEYYTEIFLQDINAIKIRKEHFYEIPRATHFIPQMQDLIRSIAAKGFAYERGGSVYFNVTEWRKADVYGKLFTIDAENFQAGVRIDADEYDREQVSDFVLWKGQKVGEPAWNFDFEGMNVPGRPGWHIECSAMEHSLLRLPFDIHTGGVDLKFPHHEDEIAQSKAGYGVEPVRYWCHNEFLEVEGEKMSKSKGNYFTLRDLLARGYNATDIRWLMLSAHYGSRLNFTFAGLESGGKARLRVQEYIYQLLERSTMPAETIVPARLGSLAAPLRDTVFQHLADDLNTPKALAAIFTFLNGTAAPLLPEQDIQPLLSVFREFDGIFDAWEFVAPEKVAVVIPASVQTLAEERWAAKKSRNFAEADRIRAEITGLGFIVNDTKDGYTIEQA